MARRKNENPLETLMEILGKGPVWLGPLFAAFVFVLMWWWLPSVQDDPNDKFKLARNIGILAKLWAPYVAGGIVLIWVVARLLRLARGNHFDNHASKETIGQLSWRQFEGYVGEAFRREGYSVEETGDPAGDGGMDLILRKDGQITLVQCKHWKAFKVGVPLVRELLGVVASEGAQAGVMVTSGTFTSEAWEFARANRIRLIDGDKLDQLVRPLVKRPHASRSDSPQPLPVSSPTPAASSSGPPACPRCGSVMLLRTARRGAQAGGKFWGCPSFPRCNGTRPA
jgi:restriction system protein